ncbi:ATP-binding protein [Patescibacteria group bacterium]|nr:ATP-binding protein [Patescibacteria group bacterium]MBU1034279.1 ATP-binding protein [Patescibacteria group bacterium]MBU1630093.1 ATP-binding protein [Patescibacteria group bacterium]MBU1908165.1 ATP-binding protein [Patescibacteria group bacterium]
MSYYIIIRGPLGCGKSTIAEKLAEKLSAEYIGMDEVLEKHGFDKAPPGAPCIPTENFIKANEIVIPAVREKLSCGKVVIFDACFYHKEVIEHLIRNLEFPHFIFTLKAPLEVCIERDGKRAKTYGEDAARAVYGLVSQFDYGTNIDISRSLDEAVGEMLSKIRTLEGAA